MFLAALAYFASGLSLREASLLESQDLGIATDLFDTFGITADHSPLHFVFLNVWQRLNAHSIAFLRMPSAVACALAAVIVFVIGGMEGGALGGGLAAAFFALDPLVVDNARSLRMYAWVLLFCAVGLGYAYAYLCRARLRKYLVGFALAASFAIYTHLFSWLWVAPLAALLALDLHRHSAGDAPVRAVWKILFATVAALVPQVIHGFVALGFTRERHALYAGTSAAAEGFARTVAQTLFLGESRAMDHLPGAALLLPVALCVLGIRAAGPRAWIAAVTLVLPGLGVAWVASLSHEVEARYLNYLAPVLALCMGVGIAKARRPVLWAPLAFAVACLSAYATSLAYAGPQTDWYAASARLEAIATADDVVAVFPGYFAATFRRYSERPELVPITYPVDLDRLLARGKPVILVRNGGRFFGHIEAGLLHAHTTKRVLFSTRVRDTLEFIRIQPQPPEQLDIEGPEEPALVLAGLIGSGGYPWQHQPEFAHAFDRLRPLFASARAVVSGYDAYNPPWYQALRWGVTGLREIEPNEEVDIAMQTAGVSNVAERCLGSESSGATARLGAHFIAVRLAAHGIAVVPRWSDTRAQAIHVLNIGAVPVGLLHLDDGFLGPGLASRVAVAKNALPPDGRLVVIVARHDDYARTVDETERASARLLIDAGADVVAVLGGYAAREVEVYKDRVIAYSLGTLLRPRAQNLSASDSTGIALRLRFPHDATPRYQVFATTFDDQSRPVLGRRADIQGLLPGAQDEQRSCAQMLSSAKAFATERSGESHTLSAFKRGPDLMPALVRSSVYAWLDSSLQWFPLASKWTRLRPFDGGFAHADAYAGARGVLALGEFRRAIELDTGGRAFVWLRFRLGALHGPLSIAYAVPDDRIASKYIPFRAQDVVLRIDGLDLLSQSVPYRAGWRVRSIDLGTLPSVAHSLDIGLRSYGTHFPVAVDAIGCDGSSFGGSADHAAVSVSR